MEGVKSRVNSFLPKFINLPAANIFVEGLKSQVNSFLRPSWGWQENIFRLVIEIRSEQWPWPLVPAFIYGGCDWKVISPTVSYWMNESHYPANSFFWLVTPWVDMDCHDKLYIQDHRVCAYGSDRPKLTRLCANFLEVFTINLQCPGIPAPDSRAFVRTTQQVLERVAKRLRQSVCPWHKW